MVIFFSECQTRTRTSRMIYLLIVIKFSSAVCCALVVPAEFCGLGAVVVCPLLKLFLKVAMNKICFACGFP